MTKDHNKSIIFRRLTVMSLIILTTVFMIINAQNPNTWNSLLAWYYLVGNLLCYIWYLSDMEK